jgi:hypothetical protein
MFEDAIKTSGNAEHIRLCELTELVAEAVEVPVGAATAGPPATGRRRQREPQISSARDIALLEDGTMAACRI